MIRAGSDVVKLELFRNSWNSLLINCGPLSLTRVSGMPYLAK